MNRGIVVLGSSNTDMVIRAPHFPEPGETILGGTFLMNAGGKGANQAVAAARTGGKVTFICQTGHDLFGENARRQFLGEGIDISYAKIDEDAPSGVALITVDAKGENTIVVASGANATLLPARLEQAAFVISGAYVLLLQLEIPLESVVYAARLAAGSGVKVVLNPAPVCDLPEDLFPLLDIITPNENEAAKLSGLAVSDLASAKKAALAIRAKGVPTVIITRGSKGALILQDSVFSEVPACVVTAADTTAAGDVFNGALVVALSENLDLEEAAAFATRAAAISVTRFGAQSSIPFRREVDAFPPGHATERQPVTPQ